MKQVLIVILLLIFNLGFAQKYRTYCNARFDFCVEYPAEFKGLGEAENRDGQIFISKDQQTEIRIFGHLELEEFNDLKTRYNHLLETKNVTYHLLKKNFFVVSGFESDGKIFYIKTRKNKIDRSGDETQVLQTVMITYPRSQNSNYASYLKKMVRKF